MAEELRSKAEVERFVSDRLTGTDVLIRQLQGTVRRGAGTPEGAVVAPVGVIWLRTDGGAGTTLYVKESGAGATGWVAK